MSEPRHIANELQGLAKLRDSKTITDQEFELQKARLLASTGPQGGLVSGCATVIFVGIAILAVFWVVILGGSALLGPAE